MMTDFGNTSFQLFDSKTLEILKLFSDIFNGDILEKLCCHNTKTSILVLF